MALVCHFKKPREGLLVVVLYVFPDASYGNFDCRCGGTVFNCNFHSFSSLFLCAGAVHRFFAGPASQLGKGFSFFVTAIFHLFFAPFFVFSPLAKPSLVIAVFLVRDR
jgi:hypothetical protein